MLDEVKVPACKVGGALHDKCFAPNILLTFPPKVKWVCRQCGHRGTDTMDHTRTKMGEYEELCNKFPEEKP